MYLGEARNERERADLALIIEETLKQRIQGVKNESGVWVTPAFPKLIYVLEEDNKSSSRSSKILRNLSISPPEESATSTMNARSI